MSDPKDIDIIKFERETLKSINMPKELPMRHRIPHFSHVFSGRAMLPRTMVMFGQMS